MIRNFFFIALAIVAVSLTAGFVYFRFNHQTEGYPPVANTCVEQLSSAMLATRMNQELAVPVFADEGVDEVHCVAVPGFVAFELLGKDAIGKNFHVIELSGGKAASGADTILDYCYMQGNNVISQIRIRGREGSISTSTCTYQPQALHTPVVRYDFSK